MRPTQLRETFVRVTKIKDSYHRPLSGWVQHGHTLIAGRKLYGMLQRLNRDWWRLSCDDGRIVDLRVEDDSYVIDEVDV